MPWEASTDFEGVRPPGFPAAIEPDGGDDVPGWLAPIYPDSTSHASRVWSRLPWEPSNLSDDAIEIREQGGWGFAAYGEECADQSRKYAVREISGTASRTVSSGSCAGQIDDSRIATDWVETWDWEFRTTEDDPGTEEVDETAYEVIIEPAEDGTFQRVTNSWTPSGGSCIFIPGTPADATPPAPSAVDTGTTATWAYPAVAGYTPSGELTYTLSEEVTTTTIATMLDEWLDELPAFRAATATGFYGVIYQTESPDALYGSVGRGRVRFALKSDIPAGYKAVVDYVVRDSQPVDRLAGALPGNYWHDGDGTLTLSGVVSTSTDALGTWPRGAIATGDVDAAPWAVSLAASVVTVASTGDDGDCGLAARVASLSGDRRYRVLCRMDWVDDASLPDGDDAEFTLEMAVEEGEPNRTPTVWWTDHAPDEVRQVGFRILSEPGDIEVFTAGGWSAVAEADIPAALQDMVVETKTRAGGPWGFRNFDPAEGDPATPAWYTTASIDLAWEITGTNPDTCGDDPAGALTLLGQVTVDPAGRYADTVTTDSATFGGLGYDPDPDRHPDTRHPWYLTPPSYLLSRLNLALSSDSPTEVDLPPPHKDGAGDPLDQAVEVKRDRPTGWGSEVSRTAVDLEPDLEDETRSTWILPPSWPSAGQFATWESLRYEPAV